MLYHNIENVLGGIVYVSFNCHAIHSQYYHHDCVINDYDSWGIWLFKDKGQNQHSVLRNFPVLGRIRYISEKIGPELRQYFFANDNEGKPFHEVIIKTSF